MLFYFDFVTVMFSDMSTESEVSYVLMIVYIWSNVWISHDKICGWLDYKLRFLYRVSRSCFKTKLCRVFDRFLGVKKFLMSCCHLGLIIRFSNWFWFWCMLCGFLRGVSENRDSLKDTRRLSRLRPLGRSVTTKY